jgi:flagellar hook assembly protein FlgD
VIDKEEHVSLVIYDIAGARIRTLVNRAIRPGAYTEKWDGRNANGNPVASGVYFYCLKAGGKTLTKKMVLLK